MHNPTPPGGGRFFPLDDPAGSAKAYGRDAPPFQSIKIPLDALAENLELTGTGNILWCIDASDNTAVVKIKYNQQSGEGIPFKKGTFISGIKFDRLYANHAAQAGKWVELAYTIEGVGGVKVRNPAENASAITGSVTNTPVIAGTLNSAADKTCLAGAQTQLTGADLTRKEAFITNLVGNPEVLRVGNAAVAANKGIPLAPGETIILTVTSSIFVWNPGAANQDVALGYINT